MNANDVTTLVSHSREIALKAEKISLLAAKVEFAIALNDIPKRDEVSSVTVGWTVGARDGGGELLWVTGTDGQTYSEFDELYDLVEQHVFTDGPGVPSGLITGDAQTFEIQALIAQIPTLAHELQDMVDAFHTFVATS